jgi:hypothetical protein
MRNRNLRALLIVLGVGLLLCSLSALVFALFPLGVWTDTAPLTPTLFAPP